MSKIQIQTIGSIDGAYEIDVKDIQPIGVGQTWQEVSTQREKNTDYVNDTGRTIFVSISFRRVEDSESPYRGGSFHIGGVRIIYSIDETSSDYTSTTWSLPVPSGDTYRIDDDGEPDRMRIIGWSELR